MSRFIQPACQIMHAFVGGWQVGCLVLEGGVSWSFFSSLLSELV